MVAVGGEESDDGSMDSSEEDDSEGINIAGLFDDDMSFVESVSRFEAIVGTVDTDNHAVGNHMSSVESASSSEPNVGTVDTDNHAVGSLTHNCSFADDELMSDAENTIEEEEMLKLSEEEYSKLCHTKKLHSGQQRRYELNMSK